MSVYTELTRLMNDNPDLLFNNNNYQELPRDVAEANASAIAEIETLLKKVVIGFVRFQNFKPRKDRPVAVRFQATYASLTYYVGVYYVPLEDFKDETDA